MFCIDVAGDELGAPIHDFRQNGFAIAINQYHLGQINCAPSRVSDAARFSPSQRKLRRPLAGQLPLQRPPLLVGQIGDSYLQHYSPSAAYQKLPTSEAASPQELLLLSTIPSSITCHGQSTSVARSTDFYRWTGEIRWPATREFTAATAASPHKSRGPDAKA
jgi:hypothetical protein